MAACYLLSSSRRRCGLLSQHLWALVRPQRAQTTLGATAGATEAHRRLKTQDELPGPSLLKSLYWMLIRGYILRTHELQLIEKKVYGPIWKSRFGALKMTHIACPELTEKVLRQDGKYPMRSDMEVWKAHRDKRDLAYGPITEEGERWHALRTVLNQRMLKPREAMRYTAIINEVVSDLLLKLQDMKEESSSGAMVNDIVHVFYRFAFEGISSILFETRMGALQKQIPPETQRFINSVDVMLRNSIYATLLPKWTRNILPYWNRFIEGSDTIFAFGKKLIDQKMELLQARMKRGEEVEGEYLTYLLSNGKLSLKEVYGSMAELLLAGVDTTSNTLTWTLYHLAREPEIQNSLYQEVTGVLPAEKTPTTEDIARMPLLKAIIKETLRLYPVVPANSRIATEKEIVIGDYCFPKETMFVFCHYAMSRDETNFPEPTKFLPQRWLRDVGMKHHPFSSIPFGYGVRACVGRRVAELEMYLALCRIISKFELKPDPQMKDVKHVSRVNLTPNKPINLQFIERRKSGE
uniref:Sterol 26-hydroxylase, mitochondrial-like n=1 Tax=Geotrypetes seraphini TaxID=260995 RepID=A0A6P8RG18_GEOSA|nr:sterol 26-hydroxylase, mitochondrial-like [Geotrypetes seraphini]